MYFLKVLCLILGLLCPLFISQYLYVSACTPPDQKYYYIMPCVVKCYLDRPYQVRHWAVAVVPSIFWFSMHKRSLAVRGCFNWFSWAWCSVSIFVLVGAALLDIIMSEG